MILLWTAWGAFVLLGLWLAVWCGLSIGIVLTALLIVLPLAAFLFHRFTRPKLTVVMEFPKSGEKGKFINGRIAINNDGIGRYLRVKATVHIINRLTGEEFFNPIHTSLDSYGHAEFPVSCRVRYCGTVCFALEHVKLYDFFGLTWKTVQISSESAVTILPELYPVQMLFCSSFRDYFESEAYADDNAGTDMSEIYDYRNYVPGDNVGQINWKLSEKHQGLIVKRGSHPTDCAVGLMMYAGSCQNEAKLSAMAELTASISASLCEMHIRHELFLEDRYSIDSEEDLAAVLPKLLIKREYFSMERDCHSLMRTICIAADKMPDGLTENLAVIAVPEKIDNHLELEL